MRESVPDCKQKTPALLQRRNCRQLRQPVIDIKRINHQSINHSQGKEKENGDAILSLKWRAFKCCVFRGCEKELPELVQQVLIERNWVVFDEVRHGRHGWNLSWCSVSGPRPTSSSSPLFPWQFANRIPKAGFITRKDHLVRVLRYMAHTYGAVYNFAPSAFILPNEYLRLALEFSRCRTQAESKVSTAQFRNIWICKPSSRSRGRGITIFRHLHDLSYSSSAVVQGYICNPLLISGHKFDLRLYVCVPCFHPLVVYVYHDGLTRFATEAFDLARLHNAFSHLTNSSVNKFSPAYDERKGVIGLGCKWTLRQLRHHFRVRGLSDWFLWCRISAIILLTMLCEAPFVDRNNNSFELYGFDIIIDEDLVPWLLEVNRQPSLELDCDADTLVKKPLLHDLLDLTDLENAVASMSEDVEEEDDDEQRRRRTQRQRRSANVAKTTRPSSAWQCRFCENVPPASVGGFVRIFPVGSRCWRGPGQTRATVRHIRATLKLAERVDSSSSSASDDDDARFSALAQVVGTVSTWIPRL